MGAAEAAIGQRAHRAAACLRKLQDDSNARHACWSCTT